MTRDLRTGMRQVGFTLAVFAGVHLVGALLAKNATGAAAVEALVAELGAGRLLVTWSDPEAPPPDGAAIAKRAARGAAFGAIVGAAILIVGRMVSALRFSDAGGSASQLLLGAVIVALVAVRDELVLRGMVLRAFSPLVPTAWLVPIAGLAGAAAFGIEAPPTATIAAGLCGAALAVLWIYDRGAWLAWGAHLGYAFVIGPLSRGGPLDVRPNPGLWGGGDFGPEGGLAGALVLAVAAIASVVWLRSLARRRSNG